MTGWGLFMTTWDFEPSVVAGSVLLGLVYLAATGFRLDRQSMLFLTGVVVMFLALVSPLDDIGDDYLFSAHMLQHILLDLVAPPLFVLGLPAGQTERWLSRRLLARLERVLGQPVVAWVLGVGTLWVWHLPVLYDATLANEGIHIFEHLTFLVTGTILWWPVLTPVQGRRLGVMAAVAFLFLAALANGLLGIIFTIADTPFYSGYAHPDDEFGALDLIRNQWGLSQIADQKLGGAFMWIIGSLIFLWGILAVVSRWFQGPDTDTD